MTDFLVRRDDLRTWRADPGEERQVSVGAGCLQLRIERFALTANTVTYALLGERLGYWSFFPAPSGWGRIPAWGFAVVVASEVPGIAVGERFYGCWPMSSFVTVEARATEVGFIETSAGRAHLPPLYQRYLRADQVSGSGPAEEAATAIGRPLFVAGWLLADQLLQNAWHDAEDVVLVSASSKTAFAAAWAIRRLPRAPALIGLTSDVPFTTGLGVYDRVLGYDDVETLSPGRRTVLIDMAGNPDLRHRLHGRLAADLRASIMVGATHWQDASLDDAALPGPRPTFFFAPTVALERSAALGPATFAHQVGRAWSDFAVLLPRVLNIEHHSGPQALVAAYLALLDGAVHPRQGLIFSL